MRLTHVFLRGPCRWVWQWLSPAARIALPRVTALALACGGPTTRLPAEPVPVPPHRTEAPQCCLPPVFEVVDLSPVLAPTEDRIIRRPGGTFLHDEPLNTIICGGAMPDCRFEHQDTPGERRERDHPDDHAPPVSDVPEPSSLALLLVGLVGVAVGRRG